jgi:hypothetical protein
VGQPPDDLPHTQTAVPFPFSRVIRSAVPEMDFGVSPHPPALLFRPRRGIFSPEKSFSLPDTAKEN